MNVLQKRRGPARNSTLMNMLNSRRIGGSGYLRAKKGDVAGREAQPSLGLLNLARLRLFTSARCHRAKRTLPHGSSWHILHGENLVSIFSRDRNCCKVPSTLTIAQPHQLRNSCRLLLWQCERNNLPLLFLRDTFGCYLSKAVGHVELNDFRHKAPHS